MTITIYHNPVTLLLRDRSAYLTNRYSERVESTEEFAKRVNQRSI